VTQAVTQVPKVTGISSKRDRQELKILLSGFADQGIKREADEEVHEQAGVGLERPVARQAEMSCKQEVGQVAQDNGKKSLEKVNHHKVFRRRVGCKRIRVCGAGGSKSARSQLLAEGAVAGFRPSADAMWFSNIRQRHAGKLYWPADYAAIRSYQNSRQRPPPPSTGTLPCSAMTRREFSVCPSFANPAQRSSSASWMHRGWLAFWRTRRIIAMDLTAFVRDFGDRLPF